MNAQATQPGRRTSIQRTMCPMQGDSEDAWQTEFVKRWDDPKKTESLFASRHRTIKKPKPPRWEFLRLSKTEQWAARHTARWQGTVAARKRNCRSSRILEDGL